jgi:hypothetical protein
MNIAEESERIIDVAKDCNIGDVQKFSGKYVIECFATVEDFESALGAGFTVAYKDATQTYIVVREA